MTLLHAVALATSAAAANPAPDESLLNVTPGFSADDEEERGWHGSFNAGGTISTGNTERRTGNAAMDVKHRREIDRWTFVFSWIYGQEENQTTGVRSTTERRTGGGVQYDYFLSEKSYALANGYAESDLLADVNLRTTAGVGYGYQFKDTENWKLSAEVGLGYYNKKFYSGGRVEYPNARLAYNWEGRFGGGETKNWLASQSFNILPSLQDKDQVYLKLTTALRYDMSEAWFLQLQHILDWDNVPGPGLERTDQRLLASVGYSF